MPLHKLQNKGEISTMKLRKTLAGILTGIMAVSCLALPASASDSFTIKRGDAAGQCSLVATGAKYILNTSSSSGSTMNCRFSYNTRTGVVTIESFTARTGSHTYTGKHVSSDGSTHAYQLTALVVGSANRFYAEATGELTAAQS